MVATIIGTWPDDVRWMSWRGFVGRCVKEYAEALQALYSLLDPVKHKERCEEDGREEAEDWLSRKPRRAAPPSFILGDPKERRPTINGVQQRRLTKAQFDVLKVVYEARPAVLNMYDLVDKSGHEGAVGVFKRLLKARRVYSNLMAPSGTKREGFRWIGKIDA
jgi:hypothetical protein